MRSCARAIVLRLQAGQAFSFSGFDQSIASFYEKYPVPESGPGRAEDHDWLADPIFKKVLDDFAAAEAAAWRAIALNARETWSKLGLAAAFVALGRPEEAKAVI